MIDLDELLTRAADRLDGATTDLAIPATPRAGAPVGRMVAVAACAAVAVGGIVVVRSGDHHPLPQAPPGLLDGASGTEITMTAVPDGDDDPTTWKLVAEPGGGTVAMERQSTTATTAAVAATVPGGTAGQLPSVVEPDAATCLIGSGVGGSCPPDLDAFVLSTSGRSDTDGQAMVTGVPAGAYAVTFRAGDVRYWARPVNGVVAFPYPAAAAALATAEAIDDDGAILATAAERDSTLTPTEVAAAAITHGTGVTIPGGWYTTAANAEATGGVISRLEGRTGQIGFGGPFTAQGLVIDSHDDLWMQVITVRSADVDEVSAQLATGNRGSVRRAVAEAGGLTVLLWADEGVSEATIDSAAGALTQTVPSPETVRSIDGPQAFSGNNPFAPFTAPGLWALRSEPLDGPDGIELRVDGDDLGNVRATRTLTSARTFSTVTVGPNGDPVALPSVGDAPVVISAVPPEVASLTVTLDDGTDAEMTLVGLQPYADAKVALPPADLVPPSGGWGGRRITDVRARP